MSAAWFEAAHPAPNVVCLGLRLRPYCLGHQILLRLQDSPLAGEEPPIALFEDPIKAFQELAYGVVICAQSYEAGLRSVRSRFVLPAFARVWALLIRSRVSPRRELIKFHRYRTEAMWFPETNSPLKTRSLASPWEFRLLASLQQLFGKSESEALNMPLSRATALYTAWLEHERKLELWGEDDEALFGALDRFEKDGLLPTSDQLAEEAKGMQFEVTE